MNCQQVYRLKQAFVDGSLPEAENQHIEAHLAVCPHCAARVALARRIHRELGPTLQQVIGTPQLSPGTEARIRARLWDAVEPAQVRPAWLRWVTWGAAPTLALAAVLLLALVVWPLLTSQLPATQQAYVTPPVQETPVPPSSAAALRPTWTPAPTSLPPTPTATPGEPVVTPAESAAPGPTQKPATVVPTRQPTQQPPGPTPTAAPATPSVVIASGPTPTIDAHTASASVWSRYLAGESVTGLARHDKEIWAGTAEGEVIRLSTADGTLTRLVPSPDTRAGIVDLGVDRQGRVWAAVTWQGVFALDTTAPTSTWRSYTAANSGLASDDVRALTIDAGGTVWCATAGSMVNRLTLTGTWQSFAVPDARPDSQVTALAAEGAATLWVGVRRDSPNEASALSGAGLYRLQVEGTPRWERVLSGDVGVIQAIWVGPDGHKWVATGPAGDSAAPSARGGGVVVWDGKAWTLFEALGAGMPSRQVLSVAVDARERTWVGTSQGLVVYQGTQRTIYQESATGLMSNRVVAIVPDEGGGAWLATDAGLCHLSGGNR